MSDPVDPQRAPLQTSVWNSPAAPLSIAAYVTWLAVASDPLLDLAYGKLTLDARSIAGLSGLVAQLVLFLRRTLVEDFGDLVQLRMLVLLQAAAALIAVWGLQRSGSIPVLLIIVAAQMFAVFPMRVAVALMLAINAGLAVLLASKWGWASTVSALMAYGGFQAFAALTTTYAQRAEEARDALRAINAELLGTRQLLLESARGEERLRLSRELHDVAGHKLTALKLQLRVIERETSAAHADSIAACVRLSDELLADVRGVVDTLRAHDGIDLHAALTALAPGLPQPQIRFELMPDARVASLDQAQTLLRCAQEGLTNVLRHSGARQVVLRLLRTNTGVELQIEDDGRAQATPSFGNGLRGMRERLAAFDGTLVIETVAGSGLRLRASLPSRSEAV